MRLPTLYLRTDFDLAKGEALEGTRARLPSLKVMLFSALFLRDVEALSQLTVDEDLQVRVLLSLVEFWVDVDAELLILRDGNDCRCSPSAV